MNNIPFNDAMALSFGLFAVGLVGVMARRNLVFVLMSLEILLTAAAIAFMAAGAKLDGQPDGQVVVILILTIAAAEVAVGLSLLLLVHRQRKNVDGDDISEMKG